MKKKKRDWKTIVTQSFLILALCIESMSSGGSVAYAKTAEESNAETDSGFYLEDTEKFDETDPDGIEENRVATDSAVEGEVSDAPEITMLPDSIDNNLEEDEYDRPETDSPMLTEIPVVTGLPEGTVAPIATGLPMGTEVPMVTTTPAVEPIMTPGVDDIKEPTFTPIIDVGITGNPKPSPTMNAIVDGEGTETEAPKPTKKPEPTKAPSNVNQGTARPSTKEPVQKSTCTIIYMNGTKANTNPTTIQKYTGEISLVADKKKGYAFAGWYLDKEYTKPVTTLKNVSQDTLMVYAKWTKISVNQVKITSIKRRKDGCIIVKVKAVQSGAKYEYWYSNSPGFAKASHVRTSKTKKKLSVGVIRGKVYYIKVRAYIVDSAGKMQNGRFSKIRICK